VKGLHYYRQRGSSPYKTWYIDSGVVEFQPGDDFSQNPDLVFLAPMLSGPGGAIDELVVWSQSTVASSKVRLGIYSAAHFNLYPQSLLVQVEVDVSGGGGAPGNLCTGGISATLTADEFYWKAYQVNLTNVHVGSARYVFPHIGDVPGFTTSQCTALRYTGLTYGALPSSFPAGAVPLQSTVPSIGIHYA